MQTVYKVKIDDIHFKASVAYEADEEHDEEAAIDYVLGNYYKEIRECIKRAIYVDDIVEEP